MPEISIVTPCYNSREFIERTIESVRAQTLADWEHIVVDDGSTDGSAEVVRGYLAGEGRLRLVEQPNGGVCNARNNGFAACSPDSKYLLFLDADDCLEPEALAIASAYLDQRPDVGLVHYDYVRVDESDRPLRPAPVPRWAPSPLWVRKLAPWEARTPFVSVFCAAPLWPSNSLLRRSVYEQTPGWDEALGQHHEDLDLFIEFALRSQAHFIARPLCRYRMHEGQSHTDTAKHHVQGFKFDAKWRHRQDLPPRQQAQIAAAWRFVDGRLHPHLRFQAARVHLRARRLVPALRLAAGASARYVYGFRPGDCLRWSASAASCATR